MAGNTCPRCGKAVDEPYQHQCERLVWYSPDNDMIFLSSYFESLFFNLIRANWQDFELLGEL